MAYETRDNTGSVFNNERKASGSKQPDRTGSALIGGVAYFVDGWVKTDRNGKPWLSLAFKRKDKQPGAAPAPQAKQGGGAPALDDNIPFAPER